MVKAKARVKKEKKKRVPFSLSKEALIELDFLFEDDKKKRGEKTEQYYPSYTIERLIHNEYKIRKAFNR